MNNSCPNCGAVYNVSARDIGRRIACKKCRAPLTVDESGIRVEDEGPAREIAAENGAEDLPAEPTHRRSPRSPGSATLPAWMTVSTLPTALFGLGVFLVVVFSFFPAIDRAAARGTEAAIARGDLADQRDELQTSQLNDGNPNAEDTEARRKRSRDWQRKKSLLQIDAELARAEADLALVWNQRGLLFGFVVLSFAGVGYMVTEQPPARKVLGGVLLLLIFLAVTGGGLTIALGPGVR